MKWEALLLAIGFTLLAILASGSKVQVYERHDNVEGRLNFVMR